MHNDIQIYDNALSIESCDAIIKKFTTDNKTLPDPQPDYSRRLYLNLSHHMDWLQIVAPLVETTNEMSSDYFSVPQGFESVAVTEWIDDSFIMAHYRPGDDLALHVDGQNTESPFNGYRLATVLFFLNECDGGELEFPLQKTTISPQKGRAVFFPPHHGFPHRVLKCQSDRFIVQTWLTDPYMQVLARD